MLKTQSYVAFLYKEHANVFCHPTQGKSVSVPRRNGLSRERSYSHTSPTAYVLCSMLHSPESEIKPTPRGLFLPALEGKTKAKQKTKSWWKKRKRRNRKMAKEVLLTACNTLDKVKGSGNWAKGMYQPPCALVSLTGWQRKVCGSFAIGFDVGGCLR